MSEAAMSDFHSAVPADCVFCQSLRPFAPDDDFILYHDDLVAVSHMVDADGRTYLGQVALQTKRHAHGFAELTNDEAQAVGLAMSHVSWALKRCTGAANVYAIFFAEVVPHLHVLMTARYPDTPETYWRMNILDWPDAPRGDEAAVMRLCADLRGALASRS
jgi:diadenosine tetraphosphate (Ap4A) HIT family hydrolase